MISKISQQNIEHIFFFMMLDTAFYREKVNENRFVILIYYECRYAQFALSSVIELPRIPAYYPNLFRTIAILINNAFKTVQQSAKDKEDICRRADTRQRYLTQDFTL